MKRRIIWARVLRAEPGQLYELSDGESVWLARTETVGRDEIHFSLVERLPGHMPAPVRITLLLAIVKFDRFEWAIEKATELGADEIVPLAAERSEKGLLAAAAKRAGRWERILDRSRRSRRGGCVFRCCAKPQSRGTRSRAANAQVRLLLSERCRCACRCANCSSLRLQPFAARAPPDVAIAIGPEGGWTDAEFSAAAARRFCGGGIGSKHSAHGNGRVRRAGGGAICVRRVPAATDELQNLRKTEVSEGESVSESDERSRQTTESRCRRGTRIYTTRSTRFVWKYGSDVVSLLAPQPGERILDLGCGTGHLTAQIAESGAQRVGVDRSPEMVLRRARHIPI